MLLLPFETRGRTMYVPSETVRNVSYLADSDLRQCQ